MCARALANCWVRAMGPSARVLKIKAIVLFIGRAAGIASKVMPGAKVGLAVPRHA